MSDHDDTIATLADTVQRWKASHDALVAENQRLSEEIRVRVREQSQIPVIPAGAQQKMERLEAENQQCTICGHKWRQHDPEDGRCDSHSSEGLGVCECGRDLAWMNGKIAALSRAALDGTP